MDAAVKLWTERRMAWLTDQFGWDRILTARVVLPGGEFFPDPFDRSRRAVRVLLDQLCVYMDLERERIELEFYSQGHAEAMRMSLVSTEPGSVGLYDEQDGKTTLWLEVSHTGDQMLLAAALAHELGHVRLLGQRRISPEVPDHEPLTDLLTVFMGLGVVTANAILRDTSYHVGIREEWHIRRYGYLDGPMFGYALALFAWVRDEWDPRWAGLLRADVREPFFRGLHYLVKTADSTYARHGELHPDELAPYPGEIPSQTAALATATPTEPPVDEPPELLDAEPENADDYFTRAVSLMSIGDYEHAVEDLTEAIGRAPEDGEIYQQRSLANSYLERFDEALADAHQAVRLDPLEVDSYRARGLAFLGQGDYQQAIADFDWVLQERVQDAESYYWRGLACVGLGQFEQALTDYTDASYNAPNWTDIYLARAHAYEQLGIMDKARADREEAARRDPYRAEDR